MLHDFIVENRPEIIQRCRAKVATRSMPPPTAAELDHGVPMFLDDLNDALRVPDIINRGIGRTTLQRRHDLVSYGFSVSQVVLDFSDLCQVIIELAVEMNHPISTENFEMLNRSLDDVIAGVVSEYRRERTEFGVDGESGRGSERLTFFAHEMRNVINTAIAAHEVLKTGNAGIYGNTSAVLERSLTAARALIGRSLAEIRLTQNLLNREVFTVSGFTAEVALAASLETSARGRTFLVMPVEDDISIFADRQVLAAVVGNLLQNAFKFTRPDTTVPGENFKELFRPFEQRSVNRTGLGLGLAFSRWGAEASDGQIYARNLPGRGCVFTVDLPRVQVPAGVR